ncbi:MAG: TetR/AcrR family transcriptional regulator [Candidatus Dormibacteraeota bacterium]|nr:TetR/AcrR family transcriptional regulator [Candidatus Dormibacteraeota bacterium]
MIAVRRPRRSQRERAESTRAALVVAAGELFGESGFHQVPAQAVVRQAGVTSGALYHHFRDKRDLFRAAFEAAEVRLAERVAAAARAGDGPWERLQMGVAEYLAVCAEAPARRLLLVDGPSVLGWEEWRRIDAAHHLRPLRAVLAGAMRVGIIERRSPEPLARLLLGALTEAGLGDPEDRDALRHSALWLLDQLKRKT